MIIKLTIIAFATYCIVLSCNNTKKTTNSIAATIINDGPIGFPSAEGFGKYTTGGRGGKVIIVTNLNDDGEGSFRKAVTSNEARIIVFQVSGTIHLLSPLSIKGNVTIAGQTAPGDGICIADHTVNVVGNNVIIRYMRFRLGDRYQNKGKIHGSGHDDALTIVKRKNIIVDHCSMSWSTDECFSAYNNDSVTIQWNLINEPLNYSYHFEKGDTDYEKHGFGGIWGGNHTSAHHNIFAHCQNRTPRFNGVRQGAVELVDFVNNVIYNWGSNNIYAGEGGNYNIVNNYYKYGPDTELKVKFRIVNPGKNEEIDYGKWYVRGNYVDGANDVTKDNFQGIKLGQNGTDADMNKCIIEKPHSTMPIIVQNPKEAYEQALQKAGCSYKRDVVDIRIIEEIKNRKGNIIDVQGGFPHGTSYEISKQAWPALNSIMPPKDTDQDGMPDDWEIKNNLNPKDPTDATKLNLHSFYTNIEMYINSLA